MKHIGNITNINGENISPVDVITWGSPCQSLSIAGGRKGFDDTSGIFYEGIRVIREMLDATNGEYPKFTIWENVFGAFSSTKGEDFYEVLKEHINLKTSDVHVPRPPKRKGATAGLDWRKAGSILGDGWSIAWRVHDAQYWGVPQRRRRISVVMDFRGHSASEILFEREGLRGYFEESSYTWQRDTTSFKASTGVSDSQLRLDSGACDEDVGAKAFSLDSLSSNSMKSSNPHSGFFETDTIKTLDTSDQRSDKNQGGVCIAQPVVFHPTQDSVSHTNVSHSMTCGNSAHGQCTVAVAQPICFEPGAMSRLGGYVNENLCCTLRADMGDNIPAVITPIALQANAIDRADTAGCNGKGWNDETMYTLTALDRHCVMAPTVFNEEAITSPTNASNPKMGDPCHTLGASGANRCILVETGVMAPQVFENHQFGGYREGCGTLKASGGDYGGDYGGGSENLVATPVNYVYLVRRITPTEAERLQGFPDGYTDIGDWIDSKGKTRKGEQADSHRYKALGNSIALPFWYWLFQQMKPYLPEKPTLGSLFDGIGGFPLCWESVYGKGSTLWSSDIEDFVIAVTKKKFGANLPEMCGGGR